MAAVALGGTSDTKEKEYDFLRQIVQPSEVQSLLIDVGILGEPVTTADIRSSQIAEAAGSSLEEASRQPDRGHEISVMSKGGTAVLLDLVEQKKVNGGHQGGAISNLHLAQGAPAFQPIERYVAFGGTQSVEIENSRRGVIPAGHFLRLRQRNLLRSEEADSGAIFWEAQDGMNTLENKAVIT